MFKLGNDWDELLTDEMSHPEQRFSGVLGQAGCAIAEHKSDGGGERCFVKNNQSAIDWQIPDL